MAQTQGTGGGSFRFDGLSEGDYRVRIDQQSPFPDPSTAIRAPGVLERDRSAIATVTAGAVSTSNIVVPDPVVIEGRVADPDDVGIPGVEVYRVQSEGYYQPQRSPRPWRRRPTLLRGRSPEAGRTPCTPSRSSIHRGHDQHHRIRSVCGPDSVAFVVPK